MADDALSSLARWASTITYRHDAGPADVPMLLHLLQLEPVRAVPPLLRTVFPKMYGLSQNVICTPRYKWC